MPRRKEHDQRWDVARKLTLPEYWQAIEKLMESKGQVFSYDKVAELTYRKVDELHRDLDIATRHHIFIAIQYCPSFRTQKRKKYPSRNIQDRLGSIMSSLREQHEKKTGENLPLITWEGFAKEKIRTEADTGIRHFVRRIDSEKGFEVNNIYLKPVKKGKRKNVEDFRPKDTGLNQT